MSCIKNGAKIYFANYGMMVVGDVYLVGNNLIFRWNVGSKDWETPSENATHFVELIHNSELWWHREDIGVTVVPEDYVTVLKK